MPKVTIVTDKGEIETEVGMNKRLVLAIEEANVDISHRCGGKAKCTTCRVEFLEGEPDKMTPAEKEKLESKGDLGKYRLSCQILVTRDMKVKPLMLVHEQSWDDPGPTPSEQREP